MMTERYCERVLIVSSSDKIYDYIAQMLQSGGDFFPAVRACSAGQARRIISEQNIDIAIINTPLSDEFGADLAEDISDTVPGVMLIVKSDKYEDICCKVENRGVLTVEKPNSCQVIYGAIRLLYAMCAKLRKMEQRNKTLQEKMADIRTVNRAKWLLIENLGMRENDAHYYIEKQAMDTRLSRREVAENIIRTYDK